MSDISAADVAHLAKLARIRLNEAEEQEFASELPKVLDFVEQLKGVKLSGALPTEQLIALDKLRADEISGERLSPKLMEKLAPEWRVIPPAGGQNVVPAVFGEVENEG